MKEREEDMSRRFIDIFMVKMWVSLEELKDQDENRPSRRRQFDVVTKS